MKVSMGKTFCGPFLSSFSTTQYFLNTSNLGNFVKRFPSNHLVLVTEFSKMLGMMTVCPYQIFVDKDGGEIFDF